jgi:hypothetical protein
MDMELHAALVATHLEFLTEDLPIPQERRMDIEWLRQFTRSKLDNDPKVIALHSYIKRINFAGSYGMNILPHFGQLMSVRRELTEAQCQEVLIFIRSLTKSK